MSVLEHYKKKQRDKYKKKYGIEIFKKAEHVFNLDNWTPQEGKQTIAWNYIVGNEVNEIGYGGTRGTGKTEIGVNANIHFMLILKDKFNGIYLRNTSKALKPVFRRVIRALKREGLKEKRDFKADKAGMTIELTNGALLSFYHLEGDGLENIQGENISHITFEEPQYIKDMETTLAHVKAMWRSPFKDVVKKLMMFFNPLGASTRFLKEYFVDGGSCNVKTETTYSEVLKRELFTKKVFIHATLHDNPLLLQSDPEYVLALEKLPPHFRKAWLEGDFNIQSGIAFPDLSLENNGFEDKHFRPYDYPYYISYDWGYTDASVFGFYAMVENGYGNKILIKFKELVYKSLSAQDQALNLKREINNLDRGANLKGCVADTQIFAKNGADGTPVASFFKAQKIHFQRAKKSRISGFQHLYSAIASKKLLITKECKYFWETVPKLLLSDTGDGDVEKVGQEDHAYDETRYMIMHLASKLGLKEQLQYGE